MNTNQSIAIYNKQQQILDELRMQQDHQRIMRETQWHRKLVDIFESISKESREIIRNNEILLRENSQNGFTVDGSNLRTYTNRPMVIVRNINHNLHQTQQPQTSSPILRQWISVRCVFCNKPHDSTSCRRVPVEQKRRIVKENKLCRRCLKLHPSYTSVNCLPLVLCTLCGYGKHAESICKKCPVEIKPPQ